MTAFIATAPILPATNQAKHGRGQLSSVDTITGRHCRHAGLLIRQPHCVNKNQLTMAALLFGLNRLKLDNGGGEVGGGGEGLDEVKVLRSVKR